MNDIIKKTIITISDRINSPFLSSLLISIPFWNYKIVFVALSGDKYTEKIKFIETIAYKDSRDAAMHLIVYPILSATTYTIFIPFIDIAFCAATEAINNLKTLAILKISRKRWIDRVLQAEYFERFDREKEELTQSRQAILDREEKRRRITSDMLTKMRLRLKKQVLKRICAPSPVLFSGIEMALMNDYGTFSEIPSHKEIVADFPKILNFPMIKEFAANCHSFPKNHLGNNIFDRQAIANLYNPPIVDGQILEDLIETLIALDFIIESDDVPDQYRLINELRIQHFNVIAKHIE